MNIQISSNSNEVLGFLRKLDDVPDAAQLTAVLGHNSDRYSFYYYISIEKVTLPHIFRTGITFNFWRKDVML